MKILSLTSNLRTAAGTYHLLMGTIVTAIMLTAGGVLANPSNPCPANITNCVARISSTVILKPLETRHLDVICPSSAPYYQGKWSKDSDSNWVSLTTWSWTGLVNNDRENFSATNWDGMKHHGFIIAIACSSSPPTGICVTNPGCPDDPGTRREEGSGYSWWSTWNEKCADGTYCVCSTVALRVCCNCEKK